MSLSAKELCIADAMQRLEEAQVRLRRTEEEIEKARGVLRLLLTEAQLLSSCTDAQPNGGYVRSKQPTENQAQ